MPLPIEDYALIGDLLSAALVGRDGSIDWLCLPRFDSGAMFAALLGSPDNGRWLIAPVAPVGRVERRYRDETLVLETEFETDEGSVTLVDSMPPRTSDPSVVRIVVGNRGQVRMRMELTIRFDYGSIVPWVRRTESGIQAIAGPDTVLLHTDVDMHGEDLTTVAEFTVSAGERVPFVMMWHQSHLPAPEKIDAEDTLGQTESWWRDWAARCTYDGQYREPVLRSLITLKALTYAPSGGIVAAPTTSLPEKFGGVRNWDYRYCWLRDAAFTLLAMMQTGYEDEARAWREWLLRAVAGTPSAINIMYGVAGERRLTELELDWLTGYENSRPVRIGNKAHEQFQLDVYGEVIAALYLGRRTGLDFDSNAWNLQVALMEFLEHAWKEPDDGIWEVRGPRRHFTNSKVMAWVAVDRMVKSIEEFGEKGPLEQWRNLRQTIHDDVCRKAYDAERNTFVQYYGGSNLDASLLIIPMVGFLPPSDHRVVGTIEAIQRELMSDGFVLRYPNSEGLDGLPPGEGVFLPCTFWLARCLGMLGRQEEAVQLFERLLSLRNDVGLMSEEYDPHRKRMVGNFPQAFTHVSLVIGATRLAAKTADIHP